MKNKFYLFFFTGFLIITPFFLHAQTAEELEVILRTEYVTWSQAANFIIRSTDTNFRGSALEYAAANSWTKRSAPGDPITLGELSFLMMKSFNIKGGMMYSIFPGPRYAYRTMVSRSFIQGASDPSHKVNGRQFLIILGRVLSAQGE